MQVFRLAAEADVTLPPVEDLIADRLGQFAASNNRDREMVNQARLLLKLAQGIDRDYLRRRIIEETGDPAVIGLDNAPS